ncbi:MAG: Uma2 family endonuclease [Oculatellaceae cyanobacterium Prado106]|jgi:Uma2 family endonuclease|nr:Uma2 family endonuclease [Oculatellaceae cyanobacterium Prado106]
MQGLFTEKRHYTPEEYLALDDAANSKSEYRNGEIIPMTAGTTNHNRILLNLVSRINLAFAQVDYEVFMADVKLWIPSPRVYTYPGVMVVANEVEYHNQRMDIICNPCVIVEVLSESTEDSDRQEKFSSYRTIPSFQEYVLIDQTRVRIEHHTKQAAKRWMLQDLDGDDRQLQLISIPFTISLEDLYHKVKFAEAEPVGETGLT